MLSSKINGVKPTSTIPKSAGAGAGGEGRHKPIDVNAATAAAASKLSVQSGGEVSVNALDKERKG